MIIASIPNVITGMPIINIMQFLFLYKMQMLNSNFRSGSILIQ